MVPDRAGRVERARHTRESAHIGPAAPAGEAPDAEIAERRAKILELIASLEIVDVDSAVLDRAALPMPTELGTLDAIHLATSLLWKEMTGEDPTMATHDHALAIAAEAHGLRVVGARRR